LRIRPTKDYTRLMEEIVGYVGRGGRVTIPVEYREALGIRDGDKVLVGLSGNSIRIQTRRGALARARSVVKRHQGGGEGPPAEDGPGSGR
jgi:AbrB family looped-hinge helix DNA binding protein